MAINDDPVVAAPAGASAPDPVATYEDRVKAAQLDVFKGMQPQQQDWLRTSVQRGGTLGDRALDWFAGESQDRFDSAQEQEFLAYRNAHPDIDPILIEDARRLWIAKPQYSFQYVLDNRQKVREEVQTEQMDWRALKHQHPVLAKYLADPETASLAVQESATFKWWERLFGRSMDRDASPENYSDEELAAGQPAVIRALSDAFRYDVPAKIEQFARMAVRGNIRTPEEIEAHARYLNSFGQGDTIPNPDAPENEAAKAYRIEREQVNEDMQEREIKLDDSIARLVREGTGSKDYVGHPLESNLPAKVGRGIERGAVFGAKMAPLVVASSASGGSGTALAAINATFFMPDIYDRAYEITGSHDKALATALITAPVVGKVATLGPTSTLFRPASRMLEEGLNRAMLRSLEDESFRRLALLGARKFGVDMLVANTAFGLQSATESGGDQLAKLMSGQSASVTDMVRAFGQGWGSGFEAWLLTGFGTARGLMEAHGKAINARATVENLDQMIKVLGTSRAAQAPGELPAFDQILREIGARGDAAFRYSLPAFNDFCEKLGVKPKEILAQVFGDQGAAYDRAVAEHAADIVIPLEKLRKLAMDKRFSDFVSLAGRPTDATVDGLVIAKWHEGMTKARKEAGEKDIAKMTSEERSIYEKEKARALDDLDEAGADAQAREVLGSLAGLRTILPSRSLSDLHNDYYSTYVDRTGDHSIDQKLARAFQKLGSDESRAHFVFHDTNTGLENEAAFARRQPKAGEEYVHISFAGLKWFQDLLKDHAAGDALYREMATILHGLDPSVAKVGGDFGLILKKGEAAELVRRANEALPEDLKPFHFTAGTGATWEEAALAHREIKKGLEDAKERSPAGQRPKGWPTAKVPVGPWRRSGELNDARALLGKLTAKTIDQAPTKELIDSARPDIGFRNARSGLLNRRGEQIVAEVGDLLLHLDVDGLGATDLKSAGLADAVVALVGDLYRDLGADETLKGSHTGGDEFGAAHRNQDVLERFVAELRDDLAGAIITYTDPRTGQVWEQNGVGISFGIGADHAEAERNLSADKKRRADAGERDPAGTPRDRAEIAFKRITNRDATQAELAAARSVRDQDHDARGDGVRAGDVEGREGEARALGPADEAVVQADLKRAISDARVLDEAGVRDLLPENERAKYDDLTGAAHEEARRQLDMALRANVRQFIPQKRAQYQAEAEQRIKQDPSQRLAHFWKTGELWTGQTGEEFARLSHLLDPETKQPWRILESDIVQRYGPEVAEALRRLNLKVITKSEAKAADLDFMANALGYEGTSGTPADRMVRDLMNALPEREWIKQYTDLKLKEALRPELLDNPKALMARMLDAVHNEKTAIKLQRDLQAMARQLDPMRQAKAAMDRGMREALADKILDNRSMDEIRPEQFSNSAARWMERAQQNLLDKKYDQAFDAVDAALTNHFLYVRSRDRMARLEKHFTEIVDRATSDSWKRKLGTADPAYQTLHAALLGAIGVTDPVDGAAAALDTFLERVSANSQDVNLAAGKEWDLDTVRQVLSGQRSWKELLPSEAEQVYKAIKNIQHIAAEQNKILDAVRRAEVEQSRAQIIEHLKQPQELFPGGAPVEPAHPLTQDQNVAEKPGVIKQLWGNFSLNVTGANLEAPRIMLKDLGPAGEKIWGAFLDARAREATLLRALYEPWKATQKMWEKDPDYRKPLPGLAAELRVPGFSGELTKQYLVNALRWLGSESGREKLLKGLNVPLEKLTDAIGRYLTVDEINAVQREWDYFEQHHWPLLSETHLKRYGLPLEKVKPMDTVIKLATGNEVTLRGGYWPVHWDRREGVASWLQSPTTDSGAGTINPAVGDGSFKERTKFVGMPDLNWDNIPGHLLADIHSIAYGDYVQQTNRVLLDPNVLKAISERFGPEFAKQPRDWLWSVARASRDHMVEALQGLNKAERVGRSALITAALGLNIPTAIADITGPLQTMVMRHGGIAMVTHAAPAMSRVLQSYITFLATGENPVVDAARAESTVLAARADTLREDMTRWYGTNLDGSTGFRHGGDKYMTAVQETAFWHHRVMDGLVSTMIYEGEKSYGLSKGLSMEDAIAKANDAVLAAMPSYDTKELPALMRHKHGAIVSALLVFHTVNAKIYEQIIEQKHALAARWFSDAGLAKVSKATGAAMLAGRALAMLTFYAVIGDYIMGQGKQETEDWSDWMIRKELAAPFKILPFGSTLAEPVVDTMVTGRKQRDIDIQVPQLAPALNTMRAIQMGFDNRATNEAALMSALNAALTLGGQPSRAPLRAAQYLYHVADETEEPRGALDVLSGIVYGKKFDRLSRYNQANPLTDLQSVVEEE